MREYTVQIAGREYGLRYTLESRHEIERQTKKGIFDSMFSGELFDQAVIVAAGLRHADRNITPAKVIALLDKHQEQGGNYDDIVTVTYRAVFESKLLGRVKDEAALAKLLDFEDQEGKATPSAS